MANSAVEPRRSNRPTVSEETLERQSVVPHDGDARKRRMSAVIARVAEEDRDLLIKLAR